MRTRNLSVVALLAVGAMAAAGATSAVAVGGLLPHPGPDGLVWVEEVVGDGGVASAGVSESLPTVLTVACEGGGAVGVTMQSQGYQVADFTVDCPVGAAGVGSVALDPGVARSGSFTVDVDASDESIRWSLTVTQPE